MTNHSEAFQIFLDEANEHLEVLEQQLLHLCDEEEQLSTSETMSTVFRAAHSLKGSSAIAGLADLATVAHEMEDVLDALRGEEFEATSEVIDILLEGVDKCTALLRAEAESTEPPSFAQLVASLHQLVADRPREERMDDISIDGLEECGTFEICFQPLPLVDDASFEKQLEALKALGYVEEFRDCTQENDESGSTGPQWFLRLQAYATEEEIRLAAEPYASEMELTIVAVVEEPAAALETPTPSALVVATEQTETDIPTSGSSSIDETPEKKDGGTAEAKRPEKAQTNSTLRVDVRRIDSLMNMVGELVTVQASIEHLVQNFQIEDLGQLMESVEDMARSTRHMQEGVLTMRMVPLESTLRRFPRMVRDLAQQLDKNVKLVITGQDTEIDKSVAEQLLDPLTHVVRNSLDHGLEDVAGREASGKAPQGALAIHASHVGGEVVIEITDDGGGIDLERLRAKAEASGLVTPGETMSEEDITQLIFHPGLSTAEQVTSVSGRGVGMDVVRTNVENLGGSISIRSDRGIGTSVRIALPLTLAVIEGLVIREYGQDYIVPLANVVESVRLSQVQRRTVAGAGDVCIVRDVTIPIVRLGEILGAEEQETKIGDHHEDVLLVVNIGTKCLAIQVDEIVDQRQLLVKNLQDNFRRVPGIIGATVMSDGNVAMIIDVVGVGGLARSIQRPGLAA